jgi:hypothetical protein
VRRFPRRAGGLLQQTPVFGPEKGVEVIEAETDRSIARED